MRSSRLIILGFAGILCFQSAAYSQASEDAYRYYNRSIYGSGMVFNSAGSMALHGNEFSSVFYNPASSSFLQNSSVEMGLNGFLTKSKTNYLSQSSSTTGNEFSLSTINAVFKVPTKQGSLVFSAGYTQMNDFGESFTANGFNNSNSISDFLASAGNSDLRLIGFNGYATDTNRVSNTLQSVLRFTGFNGINQYVEQNQTGDMGEFVLNASTEFQKNLFVGFSIGIPAGVYHYERIYLEEDLANNYTTALFDVDHILVTEKVDANIAGIYAKLGLIYQPLENFRLGVSYQTSHNLEVNENYSYRVYTTYDDGFVPSDAYPYDLNGDFDYRILQPAILQVGFSVINAYGIDLGFQAEYKNYNGLRFDFDSDFKTDEISLNRAVQNELEDVLNLSVGLGYRFSQVSVQTGVAYMPDPSKSNQNDQLIWHGGMIMNVSDSMKLNFGLRYNQVSYDKKLYSTDQYGDSPNLNLNLNQMLIQCGFTVQF